MNTALEVLTATGMNTAIEVLTATGTNTAIEVLTAIGMNTAIEVLTAIGMDTVIEVLTAIANTVIFWDTALYSLYAWPPAACWFLYRPNFGPEDGDLSLLNVGSHTEYTALYPRILNHSDLIFVCYAVSFIVGQLCY
jgi:hypothetical protein